MYGHYVVVLDWAENDAEGVDIIAVKHTLEEAKVVFNEKLAEEKTYAIEHGYEIYNETSISFDAGESGYYAACHTTLYIQGVI
jgi:hypothetical protein